MSCQMETDNSQHSSSCHRGEFGCCASPVNTNVLLICALKHQTASASLWFPTRCADLPYFFAPHSADAPSGPTAKSGLVNLTDFDKQPLCKKRQQQNERASTLKTLV